MFVCSGWIWTGSYWSNERWKLASTKTSKQFSIAVKVAIPGIVFITKRINSRTEIPHCCCRNLWHVSILNITCNSMGFHSSPSQKGGSSARKSSERRIEGDLKVWHRKNEKDGVFVCLLVFCLGKGWLEEHKRDVCDWDRNGVLS